MACYLDTCPDHEGCVVYSFEPDTGTGTGWVSHLLDGPDLIASLNKSYDTFDRRAGRVLYACDYPAAEAADTDADPATSSAPFWKFWKR